MADGIPRASRLEGLRFTAEVGAPNVVQGLFRRRRRAVAVATRLNADGRALGRLRALRRSYGDGPVWIKVGTDDALLLLSAGDVRRALEGSPERFASDPEPKRKGMAAFQPNALTISRGELWRERRAFNEAVLDTGKPLHRLADRVLAVAREETEAMLVDVRAADGELDYDRFHAAFRRIVRRAVLGESAAQDEALSDLLGELMDKGNGMPGEPAEGYEELQARISSYIRSAEQGCLAALVADAPQGPETDPAGQVPHWLFAFQDTLAANALRALAVIASRPPALARVREELEATDLGTAKGIAGLDYLEACLQEAMRLWPTTPMLSRETVAAADWNGEEVPAGTQVMIANLLFHRDGDAHPYADRFSPEAWIDGDAGEQWTFNHFSHGPQGCPGAGLALFAGKAVLATILAGHRLELRSPRLDTSRPMPAMLDYFALRFGLAA